MIRFEHCLYSAHIVLRPTNESNFRTAAYEALNAYISHSAGDTFGAVSHVTLTVLQRMETLLNIQVCYYLRVLFSLALTPV